MNMRTIAAAVVLSGLTACGGTDLASTPATTLTSQAAGTTTSFTSTGPLDFVSPCNGELVVGQFSTTGEQTVFMDPSGGLHVRIRFHSTGTYIGQTSGMTYTESSRGQEHVNVPSSGTVNDVVVANGEITASDGAIIMVRDRVVFVRDPHGVVHVARFPSDAGSLSCK
ncbi:hypothetical protein [Deinococcus hohokamensis]|uniref:Lipoprotein n=1 Tax=Deinococcus hohokamensis TaxID=309883 RepID=A0ABV9I793_9DEIO